MSQAAAVFSQELQKDDINVTDAAAVKLSELLDDADEGLMGIRVYVSGGGCSGMQYGMTFAEQKADHDAVLNGDGFDLYVDSIALSFMKGVEIDYVTQATGGAFVFNNVFSSTGGSGACGGCGSSGGGCG